MPENPASKNPAKPVTSSVEVEAVVVKCKSCKKTVTDKSPKKCWSCEDLVCDSCLGIPAKVTQVVQSLLSRITTKFACPECAEEPVKKETVVSESVSSLKAEMAELKSAVQALLAPEPPKPGRSYASAAAAAANNAKATPAFAVMAGRAFAESNEEEKRLRSVVIDGLPMEDGVSDEERVQEFFAFAGISKALIIQECYRMGLQSPMGLRHPKIKLVLGTRGMQQLVLSAETREHLRKANAPAGFGSVYLNPSRTWEERRLLLKLRRRRNELNAGMGERERTSSGWFLHYGDRRLVKRVDGHPDWKSEDPDWEQWSEDWDRDNAPRRRQGRAPDDGFGRPPSAPSTSHQGNR